MSPSSKLTDSRARPDTKPIAKPVARPSAKPLKKAYEYFESLKAEFANIQWTEGGEVLMYAKIVVAATFFFGIAIYIADLLIHRLLGVIDVLFSWLVG
jgi:preprotein translocase SecE subunit